MKIKRVISKYKNADDSLLNDYSIDHIPVATLKEILKVEPGDEQVLKVYKIDDIQLTKFAQYIPDLQKGNLEVVEFFYGCFNAKKIC